MLNMSQTQREGLTQNQIKRNPSVCMRSYSTSEIPFNLSKSLYLSIENLPSTLNTSLVQMLKLEQRGETGQLMVTWYLRLLARS